MTAGHVSGAGDASWSLASRAPWIVLTISSVGLLLAFGGAQALAALILAILVAAASPIRRSSATVPLAILWSVLAIWVVFAFPPLWA